MSPKTQALPVLMTTRKVAKMFDVSAETVRNWLTSGQLEGIKVNGFWRVTEESARALATAKFK